MQARARRQTQMRQLPRLAGGPQRMGSRLTLAALTQQIKVLTMRTVAGEAVHRLCQQHTYAAC
jgi:hypothetical protein